MSSDQDLREHYGEQLRAKISSKFSAVTFLAGFAATILTTLLTSRPVERVPLAFTLALACAMAASVLFVQAIIRFDELTMPKRFWPSRKDAPRTTRDVGLLSQDDLGALHNRMVFYWRYLTITATCLTGLGLVVLVLPRTYLPLSSEAATFWVVVIASASAYAYSKRLDAIAPDRDKLVRPVD